MLCAKCKMRYVEKFFAPLCYICGLKSKGFYRAAINELTNQWTGKIGGWWGFHTGVLDVELGWSIKESILWCGMVLAVLKCGSLNKTPKTDIVISDLFSEYWLKHFGII